MIRNDQIKTIFFKIKELNYVVSSIYILQISEFVNKFVDRKCIARIILIVFIVKPRFIKAKSRKAKITWLSVQNVKSYKNKPYHHLKHQFL